MTTVSRRGFLALGALPLLGQKSDPLALRLARAFHAPRFSDLPPNAVKHAKMILASTLASAASGTKIESARIVRALAIEQGGARQSSVWFDSLRLPLTQVVRVNAMLSDAAASDDSDLRNVAHTGTLVSAVGLAVGEWKGSTPADVLAAMAVGYEAAGRFGDMIRGGRPGLHASFIVAFGGVVTASRLLGLTVEQMAHAMGITATTMGGILIGTDSWAREYMAGNAALTAIEAALAAQKGFTVNPDLLEAKGGFLDTFGNGKADFRPLSAPWDIERYLAIKLVPGAHALHSSLDAAIQASKQANVPAEQIARIIHSGPPKTSITYEPVVPKDMVEAIHSLPYFLATGVADRTFDWSHITLEKMRRPEIARLIVLVEYEAVPASAHYDWNWGGTVTLVTKSGARVSSTVDAPRGSGPRGIEWADVDTKYRALIDDSGLSAARQASLLAAVHDFEHVGSVSGFVKRVTR
ncbi:MAG: MmgE/PrpD family protein [Bryobacteraceae bacterium]